jgi:hypothetical protein
MRTISLPLAISLGLAATATLAADTPLRPEQVREAMGLKLGAWHTILTVRDVRLVPAPGDDKEAAKRAERFVRTELKKDGARDECLSDIPDRIAVPGIHAGPECDFSRIEASGGRFAVTGICRDSPSDARSIEVAITGRYTPESLTSHSEARSTVDGARLLIKLDLESRYIGQCPPPPVAVTPPPKSD